MRASPRNRDLRPQIALVLNCALAAGAAVAAALTSESADWRPVHLLVILGGFAVASELLPLRVRRPSTRSTSWRITSSAPVVLAMVFLGPAPAVAIGFASLPLAGIVERTAWRDVIANFANYGVLLLTGALLTDSLIGGLGLSEDDPAQVLVVIGLYAYVVTVSFVLNSSYGALAYGESVFAASSHEWRIQLGVEFPIALITALTAHIYGTAGLVGLLMLAALQVVFMGLARELHRSYERAATLAQQRDELVRLHADLAQYANKVSDLLASRVRLVAQILDAEQGERRRLAEALHDEAIQNLLAARQDLADAEATPHAERMQAALDATIDQLRDAIFDLHPAVFDQLGLIAAVNAVANHAARRGGFEVAVDVRSARDVSGHDVLLFSIARELLANAAAHAGASRVDVKIAEAPEWVCLEVSDDGCGFERPRLQCAVEEGHIGLASTADRIEALGGSFEISSERGRGTYVRATIPLKAAPILVRRPGHFLSAVRPVPAAVEVSG